MKVLSLPFTKKMGIKRSVSPEYLLQIDSNKKSYNHLGTIHASASYALAETTSGYLLQTNFSEIADQTIPILRSSTVKYKKGETGNLYSTAKFEHTTVNEILQTLHSKRRVLIEIKVKLYNDQKELVMSGNFEWFVTLP